jgi:hypothetical protein
MTITSNNNPYICAACDGEKKLIMQPGNFKTPCGYCDEKGVLPNQWWYDSVKRRCGKKTRDSIQTEMVFM